MGMDVYGNAPTAPEGEYFRRSVWGWHPLAALCEDLAPDVTTNCLHWHSNDGDGLDADDALLLAQALDTALANGAAQAWIGARHACLAAMADEPCHICHSTGVRTDALGIEHGQPDRKIDTPGHPRHGQTGWCNGCDGRGTKRPFATHYRVDESDVRDFITFLKACGGFSIC